MSWIGFRACGVTRAKKRVTAVACPCLTGLGFRQFKLHHDSSDNYGPLWITLINIFIYFLIVLHFFFYKIIVLHFVFYFVFSFSFFHAAAFVVLSIRSFYFTILS